MNTAKFSVQNPLAINLLMGIAAFAGLVSCFTIQKEAFPPITFDVVTVRTVYPGASPSIVEKYVTIKLEDELKGVDGIDEMTSISAENISLISLQLDPDEKDRRKVVNDIQRAVDRVRDLPSEVDENPVVTEIEAKKFPVITVSLSGLPYAELRNQAKILENQLLDLDDVGSVNRLGFYEPEIWVEVDPDKAHLYHVSINEIVKSLRDRNINMMGGQILSSEGEITIRTNGEYDKAQDVAETIIRSNDQGQVLRIQDVASVVNDFDDEDVIYATDGHESINLMAVKKPSGDIIDMVEEIKSISTQFKIGAPEDLKIDFVDDFSYFVTRRLGVLVNNGRQGAILILIFLFLVLALPIAASAALDIPVTFLITLLVMNLVGLSLNLMTMFGLIMVIGMVVDDAIIMAENIFRHIEKGGDVKEAAIAGASEVKGPITTAVLTSLCAYMPLALMSGIIGQYVRSIPIIVTIALSISWITTIFAIPTHAVEFTRMMKGKYHHREQHWFNNIRDKYMNILKWVIQHKYKMFFGITSFFIFTFVIASFVMKFVLFSSEGMDEFFVRAEAPMGTPIEETWSRLAPVEKELNELPGVELENFITEVGRNRESTWDPQTAYGSHLAQIHVYLTPATDRKRNGFEIIKEVEERIKNIQGFEELRVDKVRPGPPVGKAVEAKIRGNDFETILKVVNEYEEFLKGIEGAENVTNDFEEGKKELQVEVDRRKTARAGLSYTDIAREVRNAFEGGIATTIQKSDEEIDIRVKFPEDKKKSINTLKDVLIPNGRGNLIPLKQIANFDQSAGLTAIKRFDRKRMITVVADADESVTSSVELNRQLMKNFDDISTRYPGIDVIYAGEQERTQESLLSLAIAFVTAMILIYCIIAIQFKSLIQPMVIMMNIPLGLLGVLWSLMLHGKPFGFMSVMGFIGLAGVAVNESIVMVDFMNKLRRQGVDRRESILQSCQSRFRAILMASVTTVAGTMPMAYGWGGDDPFIRPMALAFAWGIAFSSIATLFAIPCFYLILDDITMLFFHRSTVRTEPAKVS